jgi:5-methylthioadenosine/S-adenosylhomocysteine deaminase
MPATTSSSVTVVRAGWVATVDPEDRVLPDGAVAWHDGEIFAVGPAAEVLAAVRASPGDPAVEVVELPGHAVLPGLVNVHTHLAMTMFRGLADDLDLQEFLARVVPAEAALLDDQRVGVAVRAAAAESLLAGITSSLDMYFFPDAALAAAAELGMRLITGPVFLDGEGPDGLSRQNRLVWARRWLEEHPAQPGWRPMLGPHATYTVSPRHLEEIRDLAAEHDALVHIHAAENEGEIDLVRSAHGDRPVELLDRLGVLGPRTVLAHAVHLTDAEIDRLAATGTSVAHCPASNLKLASGIARIPDLLEAGVNVALGTDGPASSNDLDLFAAMRLAALVHKGHRGDARLLPAAQVLRMATRSGATALGVGDALGSLEVGKLADVVAVDLDRLHTQPVHDVASALVYAAGRGDVTHVWVGGRPVVAAGELRTAEVPAVTAELRRLGAEVAGL